jgi:predicted transcriptional regulator
VSRVSTNVSLSVELRDRLDAFCDRRVVGRNLVVERALVEFLDRIEGDAVDRAIDAGSGLGR